MSSGSEVVEEETEVVFVAEEYLSSEEPPMDEWSSLVMVRPEKNRKKELFEQGLYHPGSGNECSKYIAVSDSAVFRHAYYNYPAVLDPGIKKALFQPEPPVIYADDGQELYLALCEEMKLSPSRLFHRGLVESEIDLSYYGVNPKGIRSIALALNFNKIVKTLKLTDNFLNDDAAYHLGDMLTINSTLEILDLSGCKITASGVKRLFAGLTLNRNLKTIKLSRNQIGDEGVEYIAKAIFQGLDVKNLYLSHNNIGGKSANAFAEAFETHCKLVILDLSWNSLVAPGPTCNMLTVLGESKVLHELDLSWNSLTGGRVGTAIKNVLKASIRHLNLSNNRLAGEAIANLSIGLGKAKKLITLNLSYNPMSPDDALLILSKMKSAAVKVQKIILDNVFVTGEFLMVLEQIKQLHFRKNFSITYGGVISNVECIGSDPRELVLNRAEFLAKRPKKNPVDIALIVLQMEKDKISNMAAKDFATAIKNTGVSLDDDLVDEIVNVFPGARSAKAKFLDVDLLADYARRKWPERKLPPTPPPEPEPVLVVEPKKGKKGKGKK